MSGRPPNRARAERDAEMTRRAGAGESVPDLAVAFGMSRRRVRAILNRDGADWTRGQRVVDAATRAAIIARAKAGTPVPEAAREFGLSPSCVYRILQAVGRGRVFRRDMSPDHKARIVDRLRTESAPAVAKAEGLSLWTIKQLALDAGLDLMRLREQRCRGRDRSAAQSAAQKRGWQEAREMSASRAEVFLSHAVALECAPPWVRHPQPTR